MKMIAYLNSEGKGLSDTEPWLEIVPPGENPEVFGEELFSKYNCKKAILFERYQSNGVPVALSIPWDDVEKGKIREWCSQ